ncbi:hypothetical protein AAE478_002939 [Parahypoxylon ruwenzoriense]
MQLPPASVLASWPTPNHVNPETRGHVGMIISLLLIGLVTIILAIRLYSRKWLTRGFGLDDIFILFAYFPATAFTIIGLVVEERFQGNRHSWDVESDLIVPSLQLGPLSEYWELSIKPQNCIDQSAHLIAASIINTVTDFLVVLLPIKIAIGLDLPAKQSCIIICLFGIGILASSVGIARTYFTWILTTNFDINWNAWTVWLSSAIELNLGIICASIPATKPFFASYLPGIIGSTFGPRNSMNTFIRIEWEAKPLRSSPSLTTFIDQSSSSSFLPQRPAPLLPHHQPADLNKPLPPVIYDGQNSPRTQSSVSDELSVYPYSPGIQAPPQRGGVRFSNCYTTLTPKDPRPRDRTTIFIMYREENPGQIQLMPSRASLA